MVSKPYFHRVDAVLLVKLSLAFDVCGGVAMLYVVVVLLLLHEVYC